MVVINQFIRDVLEYFKTDLSKSIDDPKSGARDKTSKFVMTSFPKRKVIYPLITLKIPNFDATRAGMQTDAMDLIIQLEVRVWARNEVDKDAISNDIYDRLRTIQFVNLGSIDQDLHDFALLSANEVDEEGDGGIKSRINTYQYKIFNVN